MLNLVGVLTVWPLLDLSVCPETENSVLKSEALLGFINIPCLDLYSYTAQCLGNTLELLLMLH